MKEEKNNEPLPRGTFGKKSCKACDACGKRDKECGSCQKRGLDACAGVTTRKRDFGIPTTMQRPKGAI